MSYPSPPPASTPAPPPMPGSGPAPPPPTWTVSWAQRAQMHGLAVAAMVVGIVSIPLVLASLFFILLALLGLPLAVLAIVLGVVSQARISASGPALRGTGMAVTGWICGAAGLGLFTLLVAVGFALRFGTNFSR